MASWFRSKEMKYVSLMLNEDAAHACVTDLGKLGVVQFTDLNTGQTAFQRRYVSQIKRCDELERKIRYFQAEIKKFNMNLASAGNVDGFLDETVTGLTGAKLLDRLENALEEHEKELLQMNSLSAQLTKEYNEKVELQQTLMKSQEFFEEDMTELRERGMVGAPGQFQAGGNLLDARGDSDMRFSYVTGVVKREDKARFERMLFRATRGNCYVKFAEIEHAIDDPATGTLMYKNAFAIFFKSQAIESKIAKICDAFSASRYRVPDIEDVAERNRLLDEVSTDLNESRVVLDKNRQSREALCCTLAASLEKWSWQVVREKSVYHTLNMFKADVATILRAEGWVIADALAEVEAAVNKAHSNMDMNMPSLVDQVQEPWPTPPTYFETNAFTWAFQEFVDTYGVPRYQEANPALFTAATFPFLYGVMYGDIGHGSCVALLGLFLILSWGQVKDKKMGEMSDGIYGGRYMIFLMGLFSVYCGLMYSDYFSIGVDLFGSTYTKWDEEGEAHYKEGCSYGDADCVYKFGVDPVWHISSNELLFFNSLKMKLSVILGIFQMTFGIILKGMNTVYFKQPLEFMFEFIPMMCFDLALFGYMVVLIFMKWSINWDERMAMATCVDGHNLYDPSVACSSDQSAEEICLLNYGGTSGDGCQPPNLITTLIGILLSPGSVEDPMYAGQAGVQSIILVVIFISVPTLLLGKPIALYLQQKNRNGHSDSFSSQSPMITEADREAGVGDSGRASQGSSSHHGGGGDHEEHGLGEVVIHQAIETIEFVLGMVSNTASYLRLWALSLAHAELATVFWEKALLSTIEMKNAGFIFVGYAIWAMVTFAVLLCMDVLECFLHALRLHWVEFQNKFYKADGFKFGPFKFKDILKSIS
eukprot:CAMPEP_0113936702 /NCGR_PEP_ID=MMETSP1339-20121228/3528_1 /TAXON_ID=94617 /ORGANISM="Fibrocapsa japonica" /LENGTH=874 /DNA_ID=CAMNT_0000939237 /DNA_START=74 /DNA_END=2698 /DNA_ORIENTATION=+ /assembly_acc=CAM_ASM_000762